jgi:hypothetical protein
MASKGFGPVPKESIPPRVGEEVASEEFLGGNVGGAICEWASALPAIALAAKS